MDKRKTPSKMKSTARGRYGRLEEVESGERLVHVLNGKIVSRKTPGAVRMLVGPNKLAALEGRI